MEEMYQCHFWIPEYAEYRTALGAALAIHINKKENCTVPNSFVLLCLA